MNRYMEIQKGCRLYEDYFKGIEGQKNAIEVFKKIKDKYGIETSEVYLTKQYFRIHPTKNDFSKFENMMKKTSYGEFKKNTAISKEWLEAVKEIEQIHKPRLFWYFDLLGHRWKERLFHVSDKVYCSIESDGDIPVPGFAKELKASEFYKIVESIE